MQRAVLVTGASGTIGSAVVARLLSAAGSEWTVIAASRSIGKLVELDGRDRCITIELPPLTASADAERFMGGVCARAKAAGAVLDGVVLCAGATHNGLLLRTSDADIERMMVVNFREPLNLTRAAVKQSDMLRRRSGSFVALSSIVAGRGNAGQAPYAASKAALEGAYRSLAREYGPRGLRFNVVAPGLVASPMADTITPEAQRQWSAATCLQRLGRADEVAHAVDFALHNSFLTGQVINVDGGM